MFNISRFKDIERREFECEVVTPLFLGGADPQNAEFRAAPIKGALRFWWRALYGSNDIESMKKSEDAIWGSTQCKSMVTVEVISPDIQPVREKLDRGNFNIYEYLGYGYRVGNIVRSYFKEGIFTIRLCYNKEYHEQVTNALSFLMYFGGIGAKTRNGFGSLKCKEVQKPMFEQFKKGPIKSFTSLSERSLLFDKFYQKESWKAALSEIGNVYKEARFELKNMREKRELIAKPFKQDNSRHAKPYFLHINKLSDNNYIGHILFMPYEYHDERKRQDYYRVCNKMNEIIQEAAIGGVK